MSIESILTHPDLWKYLSIPVVAALVGWSTNWLAVKLMFVPIEFMGYKPLLFGWQGVIPSKSEKMAKVIVQKGLQSLTSVPEIYDKIDRKRLGEELLKIMASRIEEYVNDLMMQDNATLWEKLPDAMKQKIYGNVREELPKITASLLEDMGTEIESMIDSEAMVVEKLTTNKALLNRIFQESGEEEFKFIIKSGIYFGGLFGLIQMLIWVFFQNWWILPLFGLIVGYATNAIALKIIFEPLNPIKIGPIVLQGLFLKRQKEVARILCKITTDEVITVNNILYSMLTGPKKERTHKMIQMRVRQAIDNIASWGVLGIGKPLTTATMGTKTYIDLKVQAADLAVHLAKEELSQNTSFSESQKQHINDLLRSRMENLSNEEFQDVLRPAFQEDEWKLIVVGAALGMAAGFVQLVMVFGG